MPTDTSAFSLPAEPFIDATTTLLDTPTTPTSISATAGNASATVSFSAPASDGGATITGYTVTSTPGSITATGTASPITVTGLTNGTTYTFTVTATNSVGTGSASSASNSVTPSAPDTTPPVRSSGAPSGALSYDTTSTTLSLSTDENATCKYSTSSGVLYASMTNTFSTTGTTTHSTNLSGLSNGSSYTYYVRCIDASTNANTTDYAISFSVAGDTTPPTVTITAPATGAALKGTVTFSATASDNIDVAGVAFRQNGTLIGTEDTSAPYSISWDTTSVSDGTYTLAATARDAAGNSTTSDEITVTVDNTPPVRSSGSPSGTLTLGTTSTTLSLVTNEAAVCKYSTTSSISYAAMTTLATTGDTSHSQSITGLTNGSTATYYLKCADTLGNTNATNYVISFSVAADANAPTITLTAPENSALLTGTVSVSADASDDVAVLGVQFFLDGTPLGAEDTSAPYSISWDTTSIADGEHELTAVARDASANETTAAPHIVTVDNTAPQITSLSAGTPLPTSVTVTWNTNEPATTQLSYGTTNTYGSTSTLSTTLVTTHSVTLSGLTSCTAYHFQAQSTDEAGNQAHSDDETITTTGCVGAPTAPLNLSASAGTASVELSWDAPASDGGASITDYQIQYKQSTDASWTVFNDGVSTSRTTLVTGLANGIPYDFRVLALNTAGTGSASTSASATPASGAATITSLNATATDSTLTLTWTTSVPASSIVSYGYSSGMLDRSIAETDTTPRVTSHSVTLSNLLGCTTYFVSATSTTEAAVSTTSATVSHTTSGCTTSGAPVATTATPVATSTGGTLTLGALSLLVPHTFAATDTVFQIHELARAPFFAVVTPPLGYTPAVIPPFTLRAVSDDEPVTSFTAPLTVTLSYTTNAISGLAPASLRIFRYDSGVWTALSDCSVNTSTRTVSCTTTHFSDFALFGQPLTSTSSGSRVIGYLPVAPVQPTVPPSTPAPVSPAYVFARSLSWKMTGEDVRALQRFLNTHGFPIASSGPGSAGNETTYFGLATKAALIQFQRAHNITPSVGFFGPVTRGVVQGR